MVASAGGVEVGDVVEDVEAVFGGGGDVAADSGEAEAFLALRSYRGGGDSQQVDSQTASTREPYRCWAAWADVPSRLPIFRHDAPASRAAMTASAT